MLDSHPNISCGPETRFLEDLAALAPKISGRLERFGVEEDFWDARVASAFDGFQREYAARRGRRRWADKTPRYALCIDYLDRLFPTCRVIHVIRDGRDVVTSHVARWGYWSGVKAVQKWPLYVQTARAAGQQLADGRYLEVRYEDLVADPEQAMRSVLDYVGEPWDPAVLDYRGSAHDVGPLYAQLSDRRRGQSGPEPVYKGRVGAHKSELDPLLRVLFRVRAGSLLRSLGYR